ncbi:hypothetical protein BJ965_007090 [Streptomyces luteogriseus]|uniref:Uncharacterized protein n=1 Tax=Streptomyces luteogriseus TaxID=68233 RepID=A0A7W7DV41_9ACTN|nr:hypothetical protein [Streptomyces luteogriseus]MBB4717208.1 hypothetical protein [Streptomyces luteogriseus]
MPWTLTLREGGFTVDEARQWCDDRLTGEAGPLPPVRPAAARPVWRRPLPRARPFALSAQPDAGGAT